MATAQTLFGSASTTLLSSPYDSPAERLHVAVASITVDQRDSGTVRSMLRMPAARWSPPMVRQGAKLAKLYASQLTGDLDCSDLWYLGERGNRAPIPNAANAAPVQTPRLPLTITPVTPIRPLVPRSSMAKAVKRKDDLYIVLGGSYKPGILNEMRLIPGHHFNTKDGLNTFPHSSRNKVVALCDRYQIPVDPEMRTFEAPPEPFDGVSLVGKWIEIRFRSNDDLERSLKATTSTKADWRKLKACWVVPARPVDGELIVGWARKHHIAVSAEMATWVELTVLDRTDSVALSKAVTAEVLIPGLDPDVAFDDYQYAAVAYALRKRFALIADEQGLGKTREGLAAIVAGDALPAIVVCNNTGKLVWERELALCFPHLTSTVLRGRSLQVIPKADLTIINYDIVADRLDDLKTIGARSLVMDEVHRIKNGRVRWRCPTCEVVVGRSNAVVCPVGHTFDAPMFSCTVRRSGATLTVSKFIPDDGMLLALSGTPMTNHSLDLINPLMAIKKMGEFGSPSAFAKRYGKGQHLPELHTLLRERCMIRRTAKGIYGDKLPVPRHAPVPLDVPFSKMEAYYKAEQDVITYLAEKARELAKQIAAEEAEAQGIPVELLDLEAIGQKAAWRKRLRAQSAEHLVRIGALKQAAIEAKDEQAFEWIDDFLSQDEERKIIVFAVRIATVERLTEKYKDIAVKVRGGVDDTGRMAAMDAFQQDPKIRLFVGNIEAAKETLTLTAASDVAFMELPWTPADIDQCIARCYGRANDPHGATAHYLCAPNTIEEDILGLIDQKRKQVDAAIDGRGEGGSISVLGDLLVHLAERGLKQEVVV